MLLSDAGSFQRCLDECLCQAALEGQDETVEWLMKAGADPDGASPNDLHYKALDAAFNSQNFEEIMRQLLEGPNFRSVAARQRFEQRYYRGQFQLLREVLSRYCAAFGDQNNNSALARLGLRPEDFPWLSESAQ